MNKNKICFIMCANNHRYLQECLLYLNQLSVPADFEVEILSIEDAVSMTSGYNEGMHASDAKYKVYLHQDVFIVNKNFIFDVMKIFEDATIGMIGVIGSPSMPDSMIMWSDKRVGRMYFSSFDQSGESVMGNCHICHNVDAIDGVMMITQYDLEWREDIFNKWDFYDVSQSYEFRKKGYKVVVPALEEPWCIHDDGVPNFENFYEERKKFMQEYIYGEKK